MDTLSYKTVSANNATVNKQWYVIDASDQALGRLSSQVAKILRGKNKTDFTPHVDTGDNVIVINAENVRLTGKKLTDRQHYRHTGYPGGQVRETPADIAAKDPTKLIEKSVRGMLPKNRLGRVIIKNLFVYTGSEHPHEAQKPQELKLTDIK